MQARACVLRDFDSVRHAWMKKEVTPNQPLNVNNS